MLHQPRTESVMRQRLQSSSMSTFAARKHRPAGKNPTKYRPAGGHLRLRRRVRTAQLSAQHHLHQLEPPLDNPSPSSQHRPPAAGPRVASRNAGSQLANKTILAIPGSAGTVSSVPPAVSQAPLKPLFKWTGGKRKEISLFAPYFPDFIQEGRPYKFVEPFVGAGAVFWYLRNPGSVINDFDEDVINFYRQVAAQDGDLLRGVKKVEKLFVKGGDRDKRAAAYYALRNLDRKPGLDKITMGKRAARFFVVNQLAFSGMRRFSNDGYFNIPFGHYKSFNAAAVRDQSRVELLKGTKITSGDYSSTLASSDTPDTFIFIDPPYTRVMKTYSAGNEFGEAQQRALAAQLIAMGHACWMVVIDKSDLTMELYGDYVKHTYSLSYGANIRNRFSQAAEHIVATNYDPPPVAIPLTLPGV